MSDQRYKMTINLNVLNHLGMNLYSNIQSVLSEIVANAWDADANNVRITLNKEDKYLVIEDDGDGMSNEDINNKFLNVGYNRRNNGDGKSSSGRPVMGRKGIGKLSLFSIADTVQVYSVKDSNQEALEMSAEKIREEIGQAGQDSYHPNMLTPVDDLPKGTRIVLTDLKAQRMGNPSEAALRKNIARRFSVIGDEKNFHVFVNDAKITVEDRGYFDKVQYLWKYGKVYFSDDKCKKLEESFERESIIDEDSGYSIAGWIGTVDNAGALKEGKTNLNKIALLVRGKVAQEDILSSFNIGSMFASYVIGEINADFLDDDNLEDIATSSRQNFVEDDERYKVLQNFIRNELTKLQKKWEELRKKEGTQKALEYEPISEWFRELKQDNKKKARSLFGKINQIANNDDDLKTLLKQGVLAFENLRYKEQLNLIEAIDASNIETALNIFTEYNDIESSLYYQITDARVSIVKKLKEHVDDDAKEKVLQNYLFDHLWLLDPSWERADATERMEENVQKEFANIEAKLSEEEKKGRYDIKYRTTTGKHVIIELKRASVKVSTPEMQAQVSKYSDALTKILDRAGTPAPIECIVVVGTPLSDWDTDQKKERSIKSMEAYGIRVVMYQELLESAYRIYNDYMKASKKVGRITKLLNQIDEM